jgi:hypothetical protein
MASDPGYQVTPPAPRVPAERESIYAPVNLQLAQSGWRTGAQLGLLAGEAIGLVTVFFGLYVMKYDYLSMLWQTPMGVKMLIISVLLLLINFGGMLCLCLWCNCATPSADERKQGRRNVAYWVLAILFFVFLYMPVMFVFFVGPAVIQIQENLMQ